MEIGKISIVMYVSDQFVDGKLQLTDYRNPSTKLGFWVKTRWKQQQKRFKIAQKRQNLVTPPWRMNLELKEALIFLNTE